MSRASIRQKRAQHRMTSASLVLPIRSLVPAAANAPAMSASLGQADRAQLVKQANIRNPLATVLV